MDKVTHFIIILAAVLLIICCLTWLAGTACLWGHAHRIRQDLDKLFKDIDSLAKLAKKLFGGMTESYSHPIEYNSAGYPPENDDRYWRENSQFSSPYFE